MDHNKNRLSYNLTNSAKKKIAIGPNMEEV